MADGEHIAIIDALAAQYSGEDFSKLSAEVVKRRTVFPDVIDWPTLAKRMGLDADETEQAILRDVVLPGDGALLATLRTALAAGSSMDNKAAKKLDAVDPSNIRYSDLEILESVMLTGAAAKAGAFTAKIDAFPTQKTRGTLGDAMPAINELMKRVEEGRTRRRSLYAAQKTLALHEFAAVFLPLYEQRKQARGWLDFDDLILRSRALLNDPIVAQWVLFRLDGGIDHILVDEAQDTSPAQWDVIERLAQEFTAGEGARADAERSIFVVGDKKQSIYSFQGADPEGFDRMRALFESRLSNAEGQLRSMEMEYSFRSAAPILRVVDTTFQDRADSGLGGHAQHIAFKANMPGRVDLWPVVPVADKPDDTEWYDPVDLLAENHQFVVLANRIADQIDAMIGHADIPDAPDTSGNYTMRKVRAGDILILVQRRSDLFHEIIRACKERGLPMAGADRLKVGGELAVKDIAALLSFLATPEDSLSLAAALRSPLFGWSLKDLHKLAQGREERHLWETLRNQAEEYPETVATLRALRADADFLRPYDLIERILTRHQGRMNLLARLGAEAEDGIDALLSQALSYERMEVPSLTGFLVWLQTDDIEVKRQMDSASDRIRVMTVHGAKGLEAPIVILPDTAQRKSTLKDEILMAEDLAIWGTPKDMQPDLVAAAYDAQKARQDAERDRLLYVAMTRAETWLIVAAAGELGKDGKSWFETIERGLETAGAVSHPFDFGDGLRLEEGDWSRAAPSDAGAAIATPAPLPDWTQTPAPAPVETAKTLRPSDLGGAKALPGEAGLDEGAAKLRGSRLHRLLEHLPLHAPDQWGGLSRDLLADPSMPVSTEEAAGLFDEAQRVLKAAELSFLFGPTALAEVDTSAQLSELGNARIHGAIDRLIVEDDRVVAVDFKTNAVVPTRPKDVPDGLLRQMGAYHAALQQIYPAKRVESAILWTRTATLMTLPQDIVIAALSDATVA